jgi:DNA-binding CsgD family transcriptional regulator
MNELLEIIRKRAEPGVLIFDREGRLLYSNVEATTLIPDLEKIPIEIKVLCGFQKDIGAVAANDESHKSKHAVIRHNERDFYSVRRFRIGGQGAAETSARIMVLIERISGKREIDFGKAKQDFSLTTREVEVLRLISEGYSNQNISELLFIGSNTVKWHVRNIMRKMGAGSRTEVMFFLK